MYTIVRQYCTMYINAYQCILMYTNDKGHVGHVGIHDKWIWLKIYLFMYTIVRQYCTMYINAYQCILMYTNDKGHVGHVGIHDKWIWLKIYLFMYTHVPQCTQYLLFIYTNVHNVSQYFQCTPMYHILVVMSKALLCKCTILWFLDWIPRISGSPSKGYLCWSSYPGSCGWIIWSLRRRRRAPVFETPSSPGRNHNCEICFQEFVTIFQEVLVLLCHSF